MSNRKEDEKNERIIRSLLKLPDNRRCINCKSLGPQYVCTNFWTFICTTCSGIHREFTHRVKSVSMAKFTSQEVSALQGGGNASAKEIYLKEWDPERNSLPDSSNVERLRTFIKHVYVERKFTGERSLNKPPRAKSGDADDFSENKKMDSYQGGSRSPPFNDTYERRYTDRPSPGGRSDDRNYRSSYDERRSPGSDGDYGRSPARTEIVNDWRRDDRFGNGKKSEDGRVGNGGLKVEATSPDFQRDLDSSSPPMVRPVRDILGENVSPLRVIEPPPKANGGKSADASLHTQRTASSSSLASSTGNPAEVKVESSLIDFDAVPEPPANSVAPTVTLNDNWANFDSFAEVKVSQAPSHANVLESALSDLMVPAPPGQTSATASANATSGNMSVLSTTNATMPVGYVSATDIGTIGPVAPASNSLAVPSGGIPSAAAGQTADFFLGVAGGQWNHQPFPHPTPGSQPPAQPFVPGGPLGVQVSRVDSGPLEAISGSLAQPSVVETRSVGKKELPEDLFTANYSTFPAPVPGWHTGPSQGLGSNMQYFGLNMQYNVPAPVPTYTQPSISSNPFDFNSEPTPAQASPFPSLLPLQGALPSVAAPTGLPHSSTFGTTTPAWMPDQYSNQTGMSSHAQTYGSSVAPSPYMGQPVTSNFPPRHQGAAGFGFGPAAFSSPAPNQQPGALYASPVPQNTFSSSGGNPFG
ncbi:hypothetical protein DCAR_0728387 [Daucus carota subsp. sativus]|uniref:Arf-GAP domain-containing protein n=1 Tax=Daucus carota subsp. sativus TaxID=79200 RepID=A0AAF0XIR2_DAUCS|nr:PREDICTED: probable ADP-ribosylation factor GTPase-activating protein AGD14 isoform X2 [Daucus carota subsp. sativus]WOH08936.1 hypothetical protein DCAR_0728387 [Daucus carota subsp. sativus]